MSYLDPNQISIVHWFDDIEKHRCGYCDNENSSISNAMWAETMTVQDYQNLIDRGWRRSGKYCYKPIMDEICCPHYTIRCNALKFTLSKSQKKVIKKFNKFCTDGVLKKDENAEGHKDEGELNFEVNYREGPSTIVDLSKVTRADDEMATQERITGASCSNNTTEAPNPTKKIPEDTLPSVSRENDPTSKTETKYKKGEGPDPNRPPCKKAKLLRLERKQEKLLKRGMSLEKIETDTQMKTLKQFLDDIPKNAKHKFTMKLVPTSRPGRDWNDVQQIEFELYRKYQMLVHNDSPDRCTMSGFIRFLVNSPLKPEEGDGFSYGSFHQQYWLDDELIAVGVIDVLPKCVSAVYFFYDPDYRSLTLGTYGALRELQYARELHEKNASIQYYYMGFYIHSCPKMRYKGRLSASDLLCPETYTWIPIQKCLPKLENNKYSRLNDDLDALDENCCSSQDVDGIKVLVGDKFMYFGSYKRRKGGQEMLDTIGRLIGKKCAKTLLLVFN